MHSGIRRFSKTAKEEKLALPPFFLSKERINKGANLGILDMKVDEKHLVIGLFVVALTWFSRVSIVFPYPFPFQQDSEIELNYESFDDLALASIKIEFSGAISEYQKIYDDLFFVLLGVSEGYRFIDPCTITLIVGDFNMTQDASFDVTIQGIDPRIFSVVINSTFIIPQSAVLAHATNGTLPFAASYAFAVTGYHRTFQGETDGTATVKVNGETVPENLPWLIIFPITLLLVLLKFFSKRIFRMRPHD